MDGRGLLTNLYFPRMFVLVLDACDTAIFLLKVRYCAFNEPHTQQIPGMLVIKNTIYTILAIF